MGAVKMEKKKYEKYYDKDGNVAVLYSPGYGAGWYSWNTEHEGLLFDKEIVEAVLKGDLDRACGIAERDYDGVYTGGYGDLTVEFLKPGTRFVIREYDGSERVETLSDIDFCIA